MSTTIISFIASFTSVPVQLTYCLSDCMQLTLISTSVLLVSSRLAYLPYSAITLICSGFNAVSRLCYLQRTTPLLRFHFISNAANYPSPQLTIYLTYLLGTLPLSLPFTLLPADYPSPQLALYLPPADMDPLSLPFTLHPPNHPSSPLTFYLTSC